MIKDTNGGRVPPLVVHEWFATIGGSENVVAAIREAFPGSDLLCLWKEDNVTAPGSGTVYQTLLSLPPFKGRKLLSLPLMPVVWRLTKARRHASKVVIASSHLFAHHVAIPKGSAKVIYVHTPARYIWEPAHDARGQSIVARMVAAVLKPLDRRRAQEATALAANSDFVRERISRVWNREATTIYPPVDVHAIQSVEDWTTELDPDELTLLLGLPKGFILGASRLIPYKRLDVVIRGGELTQMPVVIAGSGPEEQRLRMIAAKANVSVHFVPNPSTRLLRALYQIAEVFVFPPVEDFGIMPVEAMACGTPVASNRIGGASESVVDGITGAHFDIDDEASIKQAILHAAELESTTIAAHARKFSRERFQKEITQWVERAGAGLIS